MQAQARPTASAIKWKQSRTTGIARTKPLPGFCTINQRAWPVFWLAVILFRPCLPMHCTVAFERIRQAYSSGGCAGLTRDAISRVTGFPFHPPAEKQEGTIRVRRECTLIVTEDQCCAKTGLQSAAVSGIDSTHAASINMHA